MIRKARTARRYQPEAPIALEDRVVMSVSLLSSATGELTDSYFSGKSLANDVGLTATAPTLTPDGTQVSFSFTNSGTQAVTIGIATYLDATGTAPVTLADESLKGVDYVTVQPGMTSTVNLPVEMCTQYDAFIQSLGSTFESSVVTQFSAFDNNPASNAGPPVDSGYNTKGYQPTSPFQTPPAPLLGTLVSYTATNTGNPLTTTCGPPSPLVKGDTATIGFWQNKNGQAIIKSFGTTAGGATIGQWLVNTFPNVFSQYASTIAVPGQSAADSDAAVAALYTSIFKNGGSPKATAQFFCLCLATFATDEALNTSPTSQALAAKYGFDLSNLAAGVTGTGGDTYTLTAAQAASLGLSTTTANGLNFSVFQILTAIDAYVAHGGSIVNFNDLLDSINSSNDIS